MPADTATGLKAQFTLRLPPALLSFVDAQAASSFRTRNQVIQDLVASAYQAHQQQRAASRPFNQTTDHEVEA